MTYIHAELWYTFLVSVTMTMMTLMMMVMMITNVIVGIPAKS